MYYIYRITNLINGKVYIGQHKYKTLDDNYMGSGKHLKAAQAKYGIKNFEKDILVFSIVEKSLIDALEKEYISFYRSIGKAEYNIANGGEGGCGPHSEETKRKIGKANSRAQKGKQLSKETKEKISEAMKGNQHAKGVVRSEETRKRLSEIRRGKPKSEEWKRKISEAKKGKKRGPMSEEWKRKQSEAKKGKPKLYLKGKHWKLVDGKRVWY